MTAEANTGWWKTFLSIAITTVEIAAKVLPILLAAADDDEVAADDDFVLGPVRFLVSPANNEVRVENADPDERDVVVAFVSGDPDPPAPLLLTPGGVPQSVKADLLNFESSEAMMTIALEQGAYGPNPFGRAISFAIGSLGFGASVYIMKDTRLGYRQTGTGREAYLESSETSPSQVDLSIGSPRSGGPTITLSAKRGPVSEGDGSDVVTLPFPPGTDFGPEVSEVVVTVHYPNEIYPTLFRVADDS